MKCKFQDFVIYTYFSENIISFDKKKMRLYLRFSFSICVDLVQFFFISASSHTCNYMFFFTILKGNTDTCTYHLKLTPISLRLFQAHRYYSDIDKVWLLKSNLTGVDGNCNRSSTSNSLQHIVHSAKDAFWYVICFDYFPVYLVCI